MLWLLLGVCCLNATDDSVSPHVPSKSVDSWLNLLGNYSSTGSKYLILSKIKLFFDQKDWYSFATVLCKSHSMSLFGLLASRKFFGKNKKSDQKKLFELLEKKLNELTKEQRKVVVNLHADGLNSPLMFAVVKRKVLMAKLLVEAGANLTDKLEHEVVGFVTKMKGCSLRELLRHRCIKGAMIKDNIDAFNYLRGMVGLKKIAIPTGVVAGGGSSSLSAGDDVACEMLTLLAETAIDAGSLSCKRQKVTE
jgi:hypothetical protein